MVIFSFFFVVFYAFFNPQFVLSAFVFSSVVLFVLSYFACLISNFCLKWICINKIFY
jgi:hypothetical protein